MLLVSDMLTLSGVIKQGREAFLISISCASAYFGYFFFQSGTEQGKKVPSFCLSLRIGTELRVSELLQNLQKEIDEKYFTVACRISKHTVRSLIASILGFEATWEAQLWRPTKNVSGHPMGWAPPLLSLFAFLSVDTL